MDKDLEECLAKDREISSEMSEELSGGTERVGGEGVSAGWLNLRTENQKAESTALGLLSVLSVPCLSANVQDIKTLLASWPHSAPHIDMETWNPGFLQLAFDRFSQEQCAYCQPVP